MDFNTVVRQRLSSPKNDNFAYLQKFLSYFVSKKIKKGDFILKPGDVNEHVIFVKKGILRAYLIHSGKEYNTWFTSDDEFFISANSFYYGLPTREYIQAIEDTELLMVNKKIYHTVIKINHSAMMYSVNYLKYTLCEYQEQCLGLRFMSAEKRYEFLVNSKQQILDRLSQKHIASFLGIEETYLSKIVANYKS